MDLSPRDLSPIDLANGSRRGCALTVHVSTVRIVVVFSQAEGFDSREMRMTRPKVLLVENDPGEVRLLQSAFSAEFHLLATADFQDASNLARIHNPSVILLDLGHPPNPTEPDKGMQLLRELRKDSRTANVIVCTGCGGRERAVQAITYGAYDFFTHPVDLALLNIVMQRACWIADLVREGRKVLPENGQDEEEMIGTSDSIRRIFSAIRKVATNDFPVLITGESGTGKELTAKAIHERSLRKNGPLVPIHCAAIPETLLESELFGHERGAFTGAIQQRKGKVEYAAGGTLFLDEICDIPLSVQVKLLRFLQDRTFERVGGRHLIEVDVRIMAATNQDLKQAIERGTFREDLYYRLGVVQIHLPPLRDRGEDGLLMATVFLKSVTKHLGKPVGGFTREAIEAIQAYPWPGNVRELANKIRRAAVMAEGPSIQPQDLDLPFESPEGRETPTYSLKGARQRMEPDLLVQALTLHQGNLSRAARELGVSRPTLYRLLKKYGLFKKFAGKDSDQP